MGAHTAFVYKLGDLVVPPTVGVGFRKLAWQCTSETRSLLLERYFRTPAVQIRTPPLCTCPTGPTSRVHKLGSVMTSRSLGVQFREYAGSTPSQFTTLTQNAVWYNRCRELYSLLTYVTVRVPAHPVYTNWEIPWRLVQ